MQLSDQDLELNLYLQYYRLVGQQHHLYILLVLFFHFSSIVWDYVLAA